VAFFPAPVPTLDEARATQGFEGLVLREARKSDPRSRISASARYSEFYNATGLAFPAM
jgi:hypothetical protein